MSEVNEDIDAELESMRSSAADLLRRCHFLSARERNAQTARLAKSHQRLIPYLYARFHQMDQAQYTLDPVQMRDCAIELIPLLEDEERARAFQSDFDSAHYEGTREWMTACLYENLAEATGLSDGFNSEGMHQCIADGLQVCRRTGKLACIQCFREYACDVYTAADDLAMARHQCQSVIGHTGSWSDRGDRRWFAECKLSWLHLLEGNAEAARQACERALKLVAEEAGALQLECTLRAYVDLETAGIAGGHKPFDWKSVPLPADDDQIPSAEEWPVLDLRRQLNIALQHSVDGDHPAAVAILTEWDRRLHQQTSATAWFDVRLRLIAALQAGGQDNRLDRLADQLRERASAAADYLTLRRLQRLLDPTVGSNPLATLEDFAEGPFAVPSEHSQPANLADVSEPNDPGAAPSSVEPAANDDGDDQSDTGATDADPSDRTQQLAEEDNAFRSTIFELVDEYSSGETAADRAASIARLMTHTAAEIDREKPACMLLHFARMMAPDADANAMLAWAESFRKKFSESGGVLSLYAALCDEICRHHTDDEEALPGPDTDQIESLFRLAISLKADGVGVHLLAGQFFHSIENFGEAERCLARAFRLDRSNVSAALRLSEVYHETERPRDALAVLDMCLREGVESPNVAWEAMVQAVHLGQFESALSYADLFDRLEPGEAGVNYYRSLALVELDRAQEALAAVAAELKFEPDETLHLDAVRCAALALLERSDEAERLMEEILVQPFGPLDFLTQNGITEALNLIYRTAEKVPNGETLRQRWQQRLLSLNLLPDSVPAAERQVGEPQLVNFYQLLLHQPLSDDWADSLSCLPGQRHWTAYKTVWGVLAPDEGTACEIALQWQNRCEDLSAEVEDVTLDGEHYKDHAGVAWQGPRWNAEPE